MKVARPKRLQEPNSEFTVFFMFTGSRSDHTKELDRGPKKESAQRYYVMRMTNDRMAWWLVCGTAYYYVYYVLPGMWANAGSWNANFPNQESFP